MFSRWAAFAAMALHRWYMWAWGARAAAAARRARWKPSSRAFEVEPAVDGPDMPAAPRARDVGWCTRLTASWGTLHGAVQVSRGDAFARPSASPASAVSAASAAATYVLYEHGCVTGDGRHHRVLSRAASPPAAPPPSRPPAQPVLMAHATALDTADRQGECQGCLDDWIDVTDAVNARALMLGKSSDARVITVGDVVATMTADPATATSAWGDPLCRLLQDASGRVKLVVTRGDLSEAHLTVDAPAGDIAA